MGRADGGIDCLTDDVARDFCESECPSFGKVCSGVLTAAQLEEANRHATTQQTEDLLASKKPSKRKAKGQAKRKQKRQRSRSDG